MPITLLFMTTYTGLGGGETSLLTLVDHLDPARYTPHLLVPRDGQLPVQWRARGWQVHITPYRGASVYFVPWLWGMFPIVGRVEQVIRDHHITAIHSDYHSLPFAVAAAGRTQVPVLWTCSGWWFHPQAYQRRFFQRPDAAFASSPAIRAAGRTQVPVLWTCSGWWFHPQAYQRRFFQRPDAAFASSPAIRDGFLGNPPFMPPDKMPVLPLGVDTERFKPGLDGSSVRADAKIAPDAPLVALIARFQDVKGHDAFQEMARLIAAAIPDARFIVAGENVHGAHADDAYKARILAAHQADPILREKLVYLGFRADVERVIATADVIVCASQFESYGMVNVEAMASGKPVVSTRRGGPSLTIADGETGFLVDADNARALADKVIALLKDAALRAHMGAAGRARVQMLFSAKTMADRFAETLERLIADKLSSIRK